DTIRPISDFGEEKTRVKHQKRLYVKIPSEDDPRIRHMTLVLNMFPGREPLVLYYEDTKKRAGGHCVIDSALVCELSEVFGEESVVVK
ncbi:MAG: hypothetical protein LBK23_04500, partial [Oscillospiraceae bacterium]|nr:hypothetical protein [Oscillospiraceae bacterium]